MRSNGEEVARDERGARTGEGGAAPGPAGGFADLPLTGALLLPRGEAAAQHLSRAISR